MSFKFDATEGLGKMQELARTLEDKIPLLTALGLLMVRSVQQTFLESGSPPGSWSPRKTGGSWRLLRKTTHLFRSISVSVSPSESAVRIGTNVIYARAHQFGRPAMEIRAKKAKALRFMNPEGKFIFRKRVLAGPIPARPFVVLRPEDPDRLRQAVRDHILDKLRLGGEE